jgi:hypothetical protein
VEVGQKMAAGRMRRSARRGVAVAVLGWLGVAAAAVLMAPGASAAPQETVEIMNFTPPVKSVDKGGQLTFVNKIPTQNKGGIKLPLVGSASATVFTDVSVTFFGQKRDLKFGESTTWKFPAAVTAGSITYTYRIVPQAGLSASLVNQVVDTVLGQLPPAPVNVPYVVETLAPLPTLPGVNLPQLPQVEVQLPPLPGGGTPTVPGGEAPVAGGTTTQPGTTPAPAGIPGTQYTYDTGSGAPQLSPSDIVAAAAFDPSRYYLPAGGVGGADRAGSGGSPGSYDGASVPVFGQLAGLDGTALDEEGAATTTASDSSPAAQSLPAAALAAVVALAAVTAALVRTHQASRATR